MYYLEGTMSEPYTGASGKPGYGDGVRIALGQFETLDEQALRFAAQLGVSGVQLNNPNLPAPPWDVADLTAIVEAAAAHGLRFEAIENTPDLFYRDAILGGPGRDREIAEYQENLRRMAAAGID